MMGGAKAHYDCVAADDQGHRGERCHCDGEGGTVLTTSRDHTKEAALQAALAGVQAALPASPA
jgi:hypothetical protein